MKRVVYRQAALDELTDLIEFIAEDKPGAARRVLEVIEQRVAHFATFPESAPLVGNLANTQLDGLRRGVMTPYRTRRLLLHSRRLDRSGVHAPRRRWR